MRPLYVGHTVLSFSALHSSRERSQRKTPSHFCILLSHFFRPRTSKTLKRLQQPSKLASIEAARRSGTNCTDHHFTSALRLQYFSNAILHRSPTPDPIHAYPHLLVCFSVIQPQTTNNRTHHSCHHQCQANSPSVHFFSLSTNIYMVLINNLLPLRVKFRPLSSHKRKQTLLRLPQLYGAKNCGGV